MTDNPTITVIIPVWNGERTIGSALTALQHQIADPKAFEIIVVDNGSTDHTAEIVERYEHVKLISEPLPGSYRARNKAVDLARGSHLLFTDADCVPDPDWIAAALSRITRHPSDCLIGGRVTLFRKDGAASAASLYDEMTGFNQDWNINQGKMCITANWLCSKAGLAKVGGFDGDVLSGGDVKCARLMNAKGFPLIYAEEMTVRHPTRATLRELIRKRRRVVGGRWQELGADPSLIDFSRNLISENLDHLRWAKGGSLSLREKISVMGVIAMMYATAQMETFRLQLGFSPYRS